MQPVKKELRIKGEQIYLRPITDEDTEQVVSWRNQKDVVENFIYRKPLSVKEHEQWLRNKVDVGLVHQFIICMNEDNRAIGSVYLQKFEEEHKKAESGIFIGDTSVRGRGVGTEAVKLLAEYGFRVLGMHKIVARVLAYNKASAKLHEKAGYVQEAYLREELFIEGRYEDLLMFGIISPDTKKGGSNNNEQNQFCHPLL